MRRATVYIQNDTHDLELGQLCPFNNQKIIEMFWWFDEFHIVTSPIDDKHQEFIVMAPFVDS